MKRTRPQPVRCRIVASEMSPGLLSIRSVEGGKGGHLKAALKTAGFEVGDIVTIALFRGKITRPRPTEVKR